MKSLLFETVILALVVFLNFELCEGGLQDGLAVWFPFNGTLTDCSGKSNVFVASDSSSQISFSSEDQCGKNSSGSLSLNGTSYVLLYLTTSSELYGIGNSGIWSISVWLNLISSYYSPIIDSGSFSWMWEVVPSQKTIIFHYNYASYFQFNVSFPLKTWNHLVLISNNSTLTLYANNNLIDTLAVTNQMISTAQIYIGYGPSGAIEHTTGKLSDFRIYNRVLSEIELNELSSICTMPKESSSIQTEKVSSSEIISSSFSSIENKISSSFASSSSVLQTNKESVVVVIEFDIAIIDVSSLENEIATILGIDQSLVSAILISSTEIQVTIYGQSLSIVQQNANSLIDLISDGNIKNGLLRNAIDAHFQGDSQQTSSFLLQIPFNLIIITLLFI